MKSDDEIRDDVIRALRWDPQISDPEAIGVAVTDGAVALTGHTSTYAEKMAAERAARQVYGVRAVANDLKVRLSGSPRDDAISPGRLPTSWTGMCRSRQAGSTSVQNGWVTLEGHVDHDFQRREVGRMVRHVRGVNGVINDVTVTPPVAPDRVAAQIEEAFEREAGVDARHVRVEVADHTVRLYGHVHSVNEANAAAAAAATAPGVAKVENHLVVSP